MSSFPQIPCLADEITEKQALTRYGIGQLTLQDWIHNTDMPPPCRLESGDIGWQFSELGHWEHRHQLWEKIGRGKCRSTGGMS